MQMLPAHAARGPRRPDRAGGAGAARADPGRRRPSLHRAAQAAARGPLLRGALRAPLAGAGAARHARRDRLPGPGARGGDGARRLLGRRGRGAAAGDEPQALARRRCERYRERFIDGAIERGVSPRGRGAGLRRRSRASRASASPSRTRPPSGCSPTSRPGCGSTTGRSCSARCSTSSRWASTRPTRWSTRRSGAASRSCRPDVNVSELDCRVETTGGRRIGGQPAGPDRPRLRRRGGGGRRPGRDRRAPARRRLPRASPTSPGARAPSRAALQRLRLGGRLRRPGRKPREAGRSGRRATAARRSGRSAAGSRAARADDGTQLALPLDGSPTPPLPELGPWERIVADYRTTGMTLGAPPDGADQGELARGRSPARASDGRGTALG